jgi:protein-tyrosine phosphatase
MKNLIDIHSHILPNLDDGSADIATAVEVCRSAIEQGTSDIIATPHAFNHIFDVSIACRDLALSTLRQELDRQNLKINIFAGFECRINGGLIDMLQAQPEYTLCGNGKDFLLEFEPLLIPPDFEYFLFAAQLNGLQPILVHPERHREISKNIELLGKYIERGLQTQIDAGSVIGLSGIGIQRFAQKMIKRDFVHYIASDIHPTKEDSYRFREAYNHVCDLSGVDIADNLFHHNPMRILRAR